MHVRLTLALEDGLIEPPMVVFGAAPEGLPGPVDYVVTTQPEFDAAKARGMAVHLSAPGRYRTALVMLPRARALAQDRIARAAEICDGTLLVDGQKTDGIESMLKALRARCEVGAVISKAHGKLIGCHGGDFSDWKAAPQRNADGFLTAPGSFSADGIDPGSALLADALPSDLGGHVIDLGAGWGFLSHRIAQRESVRRIDLVEADHAALEAARVNVTDPRAMFHWADATGWQAEGRADHVVMNPPFHRGRKGDPDLGRAFIATAAAALAPRGHLWMVANRHLPYESVLRTRFGEVNEIAGTPAFKIFHATKAIRKAAP